MPFNTTAKIILEDGTELTGKSFGAKVPKAGEVVFNTAMTGYPESLTDPSYKGQILTLTYPLVGNYGVPKEEKHHDGLEKFFESEKIHISGLIISDYSIEHNHWNAQKSLSDWLKESQIPAVYGVDTRALTQKLREKGTMLGKIIFNQDIEYYDPNQINLVAEVSCKEKIIYGNGKYRIVLIDCGVKNNIIRCLLDYDTTVIRVPWDYDFTQEKYDGIFISNGPGNPEMCHTTIQNLKKVLKENKPIFGICLGNQLLGLASGATTFKLKYGHRSHNQPVRMNNTNTCFITSQNHGFALDLESLSDDWEPLFINLNDGTCEGIRHKTKPFYTTQFHPEASGGPEDTQFFFKWFIEKVKETY
ncbi:MAG: glutamine-hydrolyzing carbamoyl-phosphate synthase small subunit [Flavobacteriales bacterium]